jgi:periplasmic divalent cation tolerance protein
MSAVLVLTTMSASEDAGALARTLVEERLAACVNVLPPMQSTYRWRDQIEVEPERQLVIKTSQDRLIDLQNRLVALHPYEVPEFLVIAVTGGTEAYLTWLREQTQPDAS